MKKYKFYSNKKIFVFLNIIFAVLGVVLIWQFAVVDEVYIQLILLAAILVYYLIILREIHFTVKIDDRIKIGALYTVFNVGIKDVFKISAHKQYVALHYYKGKKEKKFKLKAAALENEPQKANELLLDIISGADENSVEVDSKVKAFMEHESDVFNPDNKMKVRSSLIVLIVYLIFSVMLEAAVGFWTVLYLGETHSTAYKIAVELGELALVLLGIFCVAFIIVRKNASIIMVKVFCIMEAAVFVMLAFLDSDFFGENIAGILTRVVVYSHTFFYILMFLLIVFSYLNNSKRVKYALSNNKKEDNIISRIIQNKNGARKKAAAILLSVIAVIILGTGIFASVSIAKLNSYIESGDYVSAVRLIYNNRFAEFSNKTDTPQMKYYLAMASHESADSMLEGEWELPDMTGWSAAEVALALKNIGQEYEIVFEDDPDAGYNHVITHSPAAGEWANPDEKVTLTVNSYYGSNNSYIFPQYLSFLSAEAGEWVYSLIGGKVYKSRMDYKDAEVLYDFGNVSTWCGYYLFASGCDLYIVYNTSFLEDSNVKVIHYNTEDNSISEQIELNPGYFVRLKGEKLYLYRLNDKYEKTYEVELIDTDTWESEIYYEPNLSLISWDGTFRFTLDYSEDTLTYINEDKEKVIELYGIVNFIYEIDGKIYFNQYDSTAIITSDEGIYEYDYLNDELIEIFDDKENQKIMTLNYWRDEIVYLVLNNSYFGRCFFETYDINTGDKNKTYMKSYLAYEYFGNMGEVCGNYLVNYNIDYNFSRFNILTQQLEEPDALIEMD